MIFAAKYKLESKSCPGVTVTLRRMGPKRRAEVELQVSASREKYREESRAEAKIAVRLQAILDSVAGYRDKITELPHDEAGGIIGDIPQEIMAMVPAAALTLAEERSALAESMAALENADISPAYIRAAVEAVDGLTDEDGKPFTAAMLCDSGPPELFAEVVRAIYQNGYLSAEKTANLSLPTTSGAPVDGELKSTSASTAN